MDFKRRTYKEETGFEDPLSGCTSDFNILQFINDNETPIDSPADPSCLRAAGNFQAQQQHQLLNTGAAGPNHATSLHCNTANTSSGLQGNGWAPNGYPANGHLGNGSMFSGNQSLPDSPPITDISGNGSSGSPSTHSEPPYSPDQYPPYTALPNRNNMILNMQNIQDIHQFNQHILLNNPELLAQRGIIQQHSPGDGGFLTPYPPDSTPGSQSQVSPPAADPRCQSTYMLPQQQNYPMDIYGNLLGTMNDQNEYPPGSKRKRPDPGMPNINIKNELSPRMYNPGLPQPIQMAPMSRPMSVSVDEYDENFHCQKAIKFSPFNEGVWKQLYTLNHKPVHLKVDVVADKGFNFSASDSCFVNQKKNHFQITVHIETQDELPPKLIKVDGQLKPVKEFKLAFCGVKAEMTNSEIQIRQSQTDRKPIPHEPVHLEILERRVTKVTVPRLHFSETTMNNHRKNGKPNPEQKYFLLVVQLIATTDDGLPYIVKAYQSDKVIVRASNPGQFEPPENDSEKWMRSGNVLYHTGQVAIGGDRALADNSLTVHGNIAMTGNMTRPSDRRLKEDIQAIATEDALKRLDQLRVVEYNYKPEVAQAWNMENRHRVGLIAQELAEVIPEAVKENGEFLTIDDSRVFYDTVAAAQELYRLTNNLEDKIDHVEKISKKLAKYSKKKQQFGSTISGLSGLTQWMNGEDGKSLSYSRTSLASSATCDSDVVHRRSRRDSKNAKACKHYCQHNSVPLCSSKVTQGTIIALVIVMALCLVTMCSLYVLDWYNRTYKGPSHPVYYNPISKSNASCNDNEAGFGCMIEQGKKNSWLPKSQPRAPLLAPFCGPKNDCPMYCCAESHQYNLDSGTEPADGVVIQSLSLPKRSRLQIEMRENPLLTSGTSSASGFSIEVVNLNMTLDDRFCVEDSCKPRAGYYNYYVPVSAYMPTIPLHLRFNIPDGKFVDACGSLRDFEHKTCQVNYDDRNVVDTEIFKMPKTYKIAEDTFELTVGGFMQSAYRFRVGYSTESCNMSEDQQGRSFDEYNIIFYRKCSPNSTL